MSFEDRVPPYGVLLTLNRLESENAELREEADKLQAFKDYVHNRLDEMGIEKDPDSKHKEAGCRIGGRLDIIERLNTPRTDADGWISVQDRLPEHGKYVLAHYYETPLLKMISTWKYNKDNPHWTNGTFTHWMPLPEPPQQFRKEGGEG